MSAPLYADLTPQQNEAATLTGPVLALAGAGTGKTKTLTAGIAHRIGVRGIAPSRIFAVTFTNKAAAEMLARIRAVVGEGRVPSWVGTFHGLGARQLRIEPEIAGLRPGFEIFDADDSKRLIRRVMQAGLGSSETDDAGTLGRDPIKLIGNKISGFKDALVMPDEAVLHVEAQIAAAHASRSVDPHLLRLSAKVYGAYQRALREANAADFGDLLLWPVRAMRDRADYRVRWAGRFDAVLADEYQDANQAQYTLLRLLAAEHRELFCVGDDDQSIYGWRGADVRHIRRFPQDFPEARQVRLEENFRSTGHILKAANAIIARDRARLPKTLFTSKVDGDPIEIVRFRNPEEEASGIVAEIGLRQRDGLPWRDMAILYRTNALSRVFEEALLRARIPHVLIGDVGFYQRAEIKDALALLRLAANPDSPQSDEAFRRVINTPARGFGPKAMATLEAESAFRQSSLLRAIETAELPPRARSAGLSFADAVRGAARPGMTLADQLSLLLEVSGYRAMLRESLAEGSEDRLDNLQELVGLAGQFHSARELLDHATLTTSGPRDENVDCVKLMTLHKSKGLEFPHVFLPGFEIGVFPSSFGDAAEERRLAYVALTRGMRRITVTLCQYRRGLAAPSDYIGDLPAHSTHRGWLRSSPNSSNRPRPMADALAALWRG